MSTGNKTKKHPDSRLERVLTIQEPEKETMFGVVGRMEVLLDYFGQHASLSGLRPFLETYYLVTRRVAEKNLEPGRFYNNPDKLELLDVQFASLYFEPLYEHLEQGKHIKPWSEYFSYSKKKSGIPFLQMLLGINAHINGDLAPAILASSYSDHRDFLKINSVLEEVIPEVMSALAIQDHDLMAWGGLFFRQFAVEEFHSVICRWRNDAWNNAVLISSGYKKGFEEIREKTEAAAGKIVHAFDLLYQGRHAADFLSTMHSVRVVLKETT